MIAECPRTDCNRLGDIKKIYATGYFPCLFPAMTEIPNALQNRRPSFLHLYVHTYIKLHHTPCRSSARGTYEKVDMTSHVPFSSKGSTQTLSLTYHTFGKWICPHPMLCPHEHDLMQSRKRPRMYFESYNVVPYTSLRNYICLFNVFIYFIRNNTNIFFHGSTGSWCLLSLPLWPSFGVPSL
jgi:hypothetical protein